MVSVVLTVYNAERYLARAIDSILTQTFSAFELLIVDDGSTDSSPRIIEQFERTDSRVRAHYREHDGRIPSLNFACTQARSRYIALMDADDLSEPARLSLQVQFLDRNPTVGVVGSNILLIDGNDRLLFSATYPRVDPEIRAALAAGNSFAQPVVMLRKALFDKVGGYRTQFVFAEDYDLWLRLAEHCELANLPHVLLRYRFHRDGISFQNVRQQVLSMVGAELSAHSRRDGRPGDLSSDNPLTLADLESLTPEPSRVRDLVLQRSASRAAFFTRVREADAALDLLDWATGIAGASARQGTMARASLIRAIALSQKRRFDESMRAVASAVRQDAMHVLRTLLVGSRLLLAEWSGRS